MSMVGVCFVFMFTVCEVLYFNSRRQKFKHSSKISIWPMLCHAQSFWEVSLIGCFTPHWSMNTDRVPDFWMNIVCSEPYVVHLQENRFCFSVIRSILCVHWNSSKCRLGRSVLELERKSNHIHVIHSLHQNIGPFRSSQTFQPSHSHHVHSGSSLE